MNDDSDDKDDTKRRTRNLSEKKRRDQFNLLVNELGTMVSANNRKMDKSTVLKSTISFLKNHNELTVKSRVHDVQEDWKPAFLSNEEFTYLLLEALEGFVMAFSSTGRICYVSESIVHLLGINPTTIVNKSIFDYVYGGDLANLYSVLQNQTTPLDPSQPLTKDNEIKFHCHIRRGSLHQDEEPSYELIQFNGYFRTNGVEIIEDEAAGGFQQDSDAELMFVCTGRLYTPQLIRDVTLVDPNRNEFTSRHSLEWKFLFLDHRAPPIIGYLPFEVLGTSGYDYYHFDDLEKVVSCHEALMQKGELTSCYYRFLTKGQQWIWLQTRFYITYHQWNSKPEFVVCTHRVISPEDIANNTAKECTKIEMGEGDASEDIIKEFPSDDATDNLSPSYNSENSETFANSYHTLSQPGSVKSVSASSTSGAVTAACAPWLQAHPSAPPPFADGSDTPSASGEASTTHLLSHETANVSEPVPQMAQFLDPAYIGAVGVLPLHLPAIPLMTQEPQIQPLGSESGNQAVPGPESKEQLQRKHEELQQMIVRQQEELRQVKEQLLLARFGILQPIINVPSTYLTTEDMQNAQRLPAQIVYDSAVRPMIPAFSAPPAPHPLQAMHPPLSLPQVTQLPRLHHSQIQNHNQQLQHAQHLQHLHQLQLQSIPSHTSQPPHPLNPTRPPHSTDHMQ